MLKTNKQTKTEWQLEDSKMRKNCPLLDHAKKKGHQVTWKDDKHFNLYHIHNITWKIWLFVG